MNRGRTQFLEDITIRMKSRMIVENRDYRSSVILAGSGRSGTTWAEDIINARNDYRVMFEPFHPTRSSLTAPWSARQYIRANEEGKLFYPDTLRILSGGIRNDWVDRFNNKLFVRKRLIKEIRAQLFLKWIKVRFPEIPIVYIIRHPFAVISSRIKQRWGANLNVYTQQEDLVKDFLKPYMGELLSDLTPFEEQVYSWCIENIVPLTLLDESEAVVCFYENMCTQPEVEVERIYRFLGQVPPDNIGKMLERPSKTSSGSSAINTGGDLLTSWMKHIPVADRKAGEHVLKRFGLHRLYGVDGLPQVAGDAVLTCFPKNTDNCVEV